MRRLTTLVALLTLAASCATDAEVRRGSSAPITDPTPDSTGSLPVTVSIASVTTSTDVPPVATAPATPASDLPATTIPQPPPASETVPTEFPLIMGSNGDLVETLQDELASAGYDTGPVDGVFGNLTDAAVREFQADFRLSPTGSVDQAQFDQIAGLAAMAPACSADLMWPAVSGERGMYDWSEPSCVGGWGIRTAFPEGAAGTAYLFRVREDAWEVVGQDDIDFRATTQLAEGTDLSVASFSRMFGRDGWPGRARSADEVAAYLFVQIFEDAPSGRGYYELLAMWLDDQSIWSEYFEVGAAEVVEIEPCVQSTVGTMSGEHWLCTVQLSTGDTLHLDVATDLLSAAIWEN